MAAAKNLLSPTPRVRPRQAFSSCTASLSRSCTVAGESPNPAMMVLASASAACCEYSTTLGTYRSSLSAASHSATNALRKSRVAVSRFCLKSSGFTWRSATRHGGGVHSPASSRPWRAIALSIRSPWLQCASIDSGCITIGLTCSRSSKSRLAARSSSELACERMAMSQSLAARAVPRALDPNSTTASMPGIEPTASAAVR